MEIIKILLIILVSIFILGLIWNIMKGFFKIIITIILIVVVLYALKPNVIYKFFGKENVENTINEIGSVTDTIIKETKSFIE